MAAIKKTQLKDVFIGVSQVMLKKGGIENFNNVAPEIEVPVTVDSLSLSMGDATLNRVKVHGLQTDWAVTSTPGDFEFSCVIPSISKELIDYFFGEANTVKTDGVEGATIDGITYTKAFSFSMKNIQRDLGLIIINEAEDKCVIFKKMTVTATFEWSNGSTEPIGIKLTGTLVAGEGSDDDDIAFLTKTA